MIMAEARDLLVVVMATRNGAAFLPAQLESLAAQQRPPDVLLVSDDGSTDATCDILAGFAAGAPWTQTVVAGPGRGYGRNFASLLATAPEGATHLALADQDDVWLPDKTAVAMAALDALPRDRPALYGGRSWVVTEDLGRRRLSRGLRVLPTFGHALVRNFAGGNTMMLNRAGADLMQQAARRLRATPVHDWWIYQVVTGAGGAVIFDDVPRLLYRQHGANLIGSNSGAVAALSRMRDMVRGRYRDWTDANLVNLDAIRDLVTPEAQALLDQVRALRDRPLRPRLSAFRRTGIHRGGPLGQAGLWASVALNRF
ncbi:glycosyltransferase [Jannaschia rubra]|uniref:glycosyltransferase n=1 Tax=Jannaschia rubra TaxID=282197 RepID=UPI0024937B75|nr:glycosyltransferase [Jannaschia rubra]